MQMPQAHTLPDGKRLHLNHGPIDLIVEAFGAPSEVRTAYAQAVARFQTILAELVAELPVLRKGVENRGDETSREPADERPGRLACDRLSLLSVSNFARSATSMDAGERTPRQASAAATETCPVGGPTARRMYAAAMPFAENFITPMAAVAGSVADEILTAMIAGRRLEKAYVNNGGDIALYLQPARAVARSHDGLTREPEITIAIAGTGLGFGDRVTIRATSAVRGIATSGWRGRSFSLGIADAVTVLARSGAEADAAATIIANAVDLPGHAAVSRRPANELSPDSDLGGRLVAVGVGPLTHNDVSSALDRGFRVAADLRGRGLIEAAALFLAGESRVCGAFGDKASTSANAPTDPPEPTSRLDDRLLNPSHTSPRFPEDQPHA